MSWYSVELDCPRCGKGHPLTMGLQELGDGVQGSTGRVGSLQGKPVEDLASKPLPRQDWTAYDFDNLDRPQRMGKLDAIVNHMGNFFDCIRAGKMPISDYESQHRSATTCHLVNLSIRLGRPLKWDPAKEIFPGDDEANTYLDRDRRAGDVQRARRPRSDSTSALSVVFPYTH